MTVSEWTNRDERQADARAEYERIMTSESPDPMGAYIETGVIGFVFGEMWRRGVLTARDRRFITLSCVGAAGAITPDRDPRVGRAQQRRPHLRRVRRVRPLFGTQLGWPKASVLSMHGMMSAFRLAEERDQPLEQHDFERWADPVDDDVRRQRGEAAYLDVHGEPKPTGADRLPRPRLPRLPLRRDLDPRPAPHPTRPTDREHLLRRSGRRRRGGGRAPPGRARPGGAHLRRAPGARRPLRRLPGLDARVAASTTSWSRLPRDAGIEARERHRRHPRRLRRPRQPGRADGPTHRRRRVPDDAVGPPTRDARAVRRHRGVGRRRPCRARRRLRHPRRLRRRRRRRRRGPARPRRRARRDGRRIHRRHPQHGAPGHLPAAAGRLPRDSTSSTRRSAAAATRRPPASCS